MRETWKSVIGWRGFYEVSHLGRIRSLPRTVKRSNGTYSVRGRVLRTPIGSHGYKCCNLTRGGKSTLVLVHHVVARAFHGPCPHGHEIRHRNGLKSNCQAYNLEYGTQSQNVMDRVRHGTSNRGERCGTSKLTKRQVLAIRENTGSRLHRELAEKYGVSRPTITKVVNGYSWAWL